MYAAGVGEITRVQFIKAQVDHACNTHCSIWQVYSQQKTLMLCEMHHCVKMTEIYVISQRRLDSITYTYKQSIAGMQLTSTKRSALMHGYKADQNILMRLGIDYMDTREMHGCLILML